jgi:hypothetical protein
LLVLRKQRSEHGVDGQQVAGTLSGSVALVEYGRKMPFR